LYKSSTFVCLDSSIIRYADIDDTVLCHGYEEGAVLLKLEMHANGISSNLCIAGTHLYWNPARPEVKRRQAEILKEACLRYFSESNTIKIIMGDLNDLPGTQSCGVHAALPSDMTSAMDTCLGGIETPPTTSTPWFTGCLDYIYYTHPTLECCAYCASSSPSPSFLDKDGVRVLLPDQYNPSDHIPIALRFRIKS
jgi:endonuclease/exonuclease/phosphatase family metal-dependent hydrolase